MNSNYDVIVIGARCGGSPIAQMLAQKGYRVLMLDRSHFPSDKPLSTHTILHSGCAVLQRLDLLEKIHQSNCPPIHNLTLDVGEIKIKGSAPAVDGADAIYSPRRFVLDSILLEGALKAGVEFRENFEVQEIVFDGENVTGVKGKTKGQQNPIIEKAKIVIGADGQDSFFAKQVQAEKYHEIPTQSGVYFSYWNDLPLEDGLAIYLRPNRMLAAVSTNDGLTMLLDYFPVAEFKKFKEDISKNFHDDWEKWVPEYFEKIQSAKHVEKWIGTDRQPNYFRKASGPGWVLAGDAALHHDSINPSGITYSLTNAEFLAEALDSVFSGRQPFEEAMEDFEEKRVNRWMPHYQFLTQFAALQPPSLEVQKLFSVMNHDQKVATEFLGFFEGDEKYKDFFEPKNFEKIMRHP